jgi:hypothetical protein
VLLKTHRLRDGSAFNDMRQPFIHRAALFMRNRYRNSLAQVNKTLAVTCRIFTGNAARIRW